MEKVKISAIQINSKLGDKKANFEKVRELIKTNLTDTDIIILPEVWTIGWLPKIFKEYAENIDDSETIKFLSEIARKNNSWVIGGSFIIKDKGKYYNTCPIINREGKLVATYSKMHLFSYYGCDEDKYVTSGQNPILVNIEGVKTGITICYDIRFPEIYRAYRKAGADLLINCAAWGSKKPIPWECMTRSRAVENQAFMVALTQCGYIEKDEWNLGHSRIIDYKGESICEIKDQKEGIFSAIIDLNSMYEFRDKCTCIQDIKNNYEVITI